MPVFRLLTLCLTVALLTMAASSCRKTSQEYQPDPVVPEIRIGALISKTGTGASTGESSAVSLELARRAVEPWLGSMGYPFPVKVEVEDTQTDTAVALQKLKALYARGIRLVVGPYSSSELAHLKPFADKNGVLLVSPSSVATSLAIPGDNIFRLVSSDVVQAEAITVMMIQDGITELVPMIRNDLWAGDLVHAVKVDFELAGGHVQDPVAYPVNTTDFSGFLTTLSEKVAQACAQCGNVKVAVYLASFGEGTRILNQATAYPNLAEVVWYGSSAFAQNGELLQDLTAAAFAIGRGLPCPIYGLDDNARYKWQPLRDEIARQIGRDPDVYALAAYDALWLAAWTQAILLEAANQEFPGQVYQQLAADYFGVTGCTVLNRNGDRAYGNYDFWAPRDVAGVTNWRRVAVYNSATGVLNRYP